MSRATRQPPSAFVEKFATLMTYFNRSLDEALTEPAAYWVALKDIPLPLLFAACDRAVRTRKFFPRVYELRQDAEALRAEFLAKHPYTHCDDCRDLNGWVAVIDEKGVERLKRCDCFTRYREALSDRGISDRPLLALAAGEDAGEDAAK
jgi:hypothetical protein